MTDPIVNEEPVIEAPETVEEVTETAPQPGEKTDSALLLKSLQEERDRRRQLEQQLETIKSVPEVYSDEGEALRTQIRSLEEKYERKELQERYPQLKDKSYEFDEFRSNPENKGMSLATAAKAFLVEHDLLTQPTPRKGLESPTGGSRAPVKTGRSEEEIAELRKNNFRQYMKELKNGTLKIT